MTIEIDVTLWDDEEETPIHDLRKPTGKYDPRELALLLEAIRTEPVKELG